MESLEPRLLLSAVRPVEYHRVAAEWFQEIPNVFVLPQQQTMGMLGGISAGAGSVSSAESDVDRWIVRLTEQALAEIGDLWRAEYVLDQLSANFQVIRGLGLPGQMLVRSFSSTEAARAALASNPGVASFERESVVHAQRLPDDPDFPSMTNLHNVGQFGSTPDADIDAPEAWDMNIGSPNVVVGVIDSGIDVTHPDLYLNIWLNQGEIPVDLRSQLADTDGDGRITFYDLNDPANVSFVSDLNASGYIDAIDLLTDPRWADGRDTDKNGFVDDLFGWNFRVAADEPFARNDPRDVLGHGTHVAGTIGAIGDNGRGVTGINWRSSLMALKFLDASNQGLTSDAVLAMNYATMMRTQFGENVRVLNASWGQSGGSSPALRAAIEAAGQAEMLFVAAAGNGNILGQGIDIDREPFYPASYDADNIVSVAASGPADELARFSNFGAASVDLAAPGIGILSTLPGGRYGTANGTSMAAPHLAGAAALVWSEVPEASLAEVRQALLSTTDPRPDFANRTVTGGRLNARAALDFEGFAPSARLLEASDIHSASDTPQRIVVQYSNRTGIDLDTLGDSEIVVNRQWGPRDRITATFVPDTVIVSPDGRQVTASYDILAPGGSWDALDYGEYVVSVDFDRVYNTSGLPVRPADLGSFRVQIVDPTIIYVNTFEDVPEGISLRTAIQHANAAGERRTIILDTGTYRLSIPPEPDSGDTFPTPVTCVADDQPRTWSNGTTGDLAILAHVTVIGDDATATVVDASGIDRAFRVYPGVTLNLQRIGVTRGRVISAGGGGILSMGTLNLDRVVVSDNSADDSLSGFGGGLAVWGGTTNIVDTTIRGNTASSGGGLFTCNFAAVDIARSTVMNNLALDFGGALYALQGHVTVTNATLSGNEAQHAGSAVFAGEVGISEHSTLDADGRFVAFENDAEDVFVVDRYQRTLDHASTFHDASVFLRSVTVAHNFSHFSSMNSAVEGQAIIYSSLFAGNAPTPLDCDVADTVQSLGHNVFECTSWLFVLGPGDVQNPSVHNSLGPLQDNGGPTWTHSLLPGNPAIDAGGDDFPLTDQRGFPRPQDGDGRDGPRPDVGALELYFAAIEGTVYLDRNRNGKRDADEAGLPDRTVFLDVDWDGEIGRDEPSTRSREDDPATVSLQEAGMFALSELGPGTYRVVPDADMGWSTTLHGIERVSVADDGSPANGWNYGATLSADGRFVAFVSGATNLVPGDTDNNEDVFLFDRYSSTIERISVAADGKSANDRSIWPTLSADGRFVAFESAASDLVTGDTNNVNDIFLVNREIGTVDRISVAQDGSQANDHSYSPSLSADGRFVAYRSAASNLVPGDTNGMIDVFVADRETGTIERVSVAADGTQANSDSGFPSLSADGRFVAFRSSSSNLVPGDTNGMTDVFVADRENGTIERVSVAADGTHANSDSGSPSLSADGRFVAFQSSSSNLVPGDTNGMTDVFVADRQNGTIERVSVAADGTQANSHSGFPSLSADGRFVAFSSEASNLVPGDTNTHRDIFVFDRYTTAIQRVNIAEDGTQADWWASGPSLSADGQFVAFDSQATNLIPIDVGHLSVYVAIRGAKGRSVTLHAGQVLSNLDFGLLPDPGIIRGRVFEDVIANGVHDPGEPAVEGVPIYLDLNLNGRWDPGEPQTQSAADGTYSFAQIDSYRDYQVGVAVPDGFSLVLPSADENGFWRVFLPAGGTVGDRDFGFRQVTAGGQFENGVIRGRVFRDENGNGVFDEQAGEVGLAGVTLFLDLNDNGVRDFDEPRTLSSSDDPSTPGVDETGFYSFPDLGNRPYTVRILEGPHHQQTTPVGNLFERHEYSMAIPGNPLGSPQDVAIADLNGDFWPDLAAVVYDRNAVSILINDQQGGFLLPPIEIPLAPAERPVDQPRGVGPIAVLAGDFNGSGAMDLAVVNSLSSNVAILLDFDGARFASETYVAVGMLPNSLAAADLDGDGDLDLVVSNEGSNSVSILRNNGQGGFTADAVAPAVGSHPFGVAIGDFNQNGRLDLAVANFGTHPSGGDLGDVRVLLADGSGGFHTHFACPVGFGPSAIVARDLDGDGHLDLAVANFLSDNVTVCRGNGDGTFTAVATLPGGSGPMDIDAVDIDGDGDLDLLVTNGKSQKVGILRNRLSQGVFEFEPAESFGVANFPGASQISLATGDLNRNGLVDLVLANSVDNHVAMHLNSLVGGAYRVALTGTETVTGLNFGLQPLDVSLKVTSFEATRTGFVARFNRNLAANVLNLYDQGGALGPADATVVGAVTGPMRGSLVIDPELRKVIFIKTGAPLAADTYTVTLVSGNNAFRDTAGNVLDGDGDGTPGDAFTATFTVPQAAPGSLTVSLPDFTRGFGQPVNLPASDLAAGIPLRLTSGLGVSRVQLTLLYDPSLLDIQTFSLSSALITADAQAQFEIVSPGMVTLDVTASNGFAPAAGALTVGSFTAAVPATAPYGGKHVLDITDLRVYDTSADPVEWPSVDDDAIHVAAFFGDTNGSRSYNSPDVTLVQRLIGQTNTGFSAYQLADPLLLADINRNGALQANDTGAIQRLIGQVPVANVPALPSGIVPPAASGADPRIFIPRDLVAEAGESVVVPVKLHVTEPSGITLSGFDLVLGFDPDRFTVTGAELGSLVDAQGFSGMWTNPAPGTVIYTASSATGTELLPLGTEGSLVLWTLQIEPGVESGAWPVNLLASFSTTTTAAFDVDLDELVLTPAPTNAADDSVDGLLTVTASSPDRPPAQNPNNPLDANNDGHVTPADVLALINYLNAGLPQDASVLYIEPGRPVVYGDVNGDRWITPLDVLLVINHLNARAADSGEGEEREMVPWWLLEDDEDNERLWAILAEDRLRFPCVQVGDG